MGLRARLTALIVLACLVPLVITGLVATNVADRMVVRETQRVYDRQARSLAQYSDAWLNGQLRSLGLAVRQWGLSDLEPAEQVGFLRLIYRQVDAVNILVLRDHQGNVVGQPERIADRTVLVDTLPAHEAVDEARLAAFLEQPYEPPEELAVRVLRPYALPGSSAQVVPVVVPLPERPGWALQAELSLAAVGEHFQEQASGGSAAVLVDRSGAVLAGEPGGLIEPAILRSFGGPVTGDLAYALEDGTQVLASFAAVGRGDWTVGVALPRQIATRPGQVIRGRTQFMYGLAVIFATVLGLIGATQLARRILVLRDAALRVAEGDLGRRVDMDGSDEITELSRAFNFMSSSLARNQRVIAEKTDEIEAYNRELEVRVDARTRELRESQDRLVETSRMAAVAQMGAGLAHELNNPVAGILGMAQLGLAQGSDGNPGFALRSIEEQALRCREILGNLRRFTEGREQVVRERVDLHQVVREVLALVGGAFRQAEQTVDHTGGEPLPVLADPALLAQALAQLLRSLRAALGAGGRLVVLGEPGEATVGLVFLLDGVAAEDRDDWLASGMGFWIAKQVLEEHAGHLIEPAAGEQAIYRVVLPAAPADAPAEPR